MGPTVWTQKSSDLSLPPSSGVLVKGHTDEWSRWLHTKTMNIWKNVMIPHTMPPNQNFPTACVGTVWSPELCLRDVTSPPQLLLRRRLWTHDVLEFPLVAGKKNNLKNRHDEDCARATLKLDEVERILPTSRSLFPVGHRRGLNRYLQSGLVFRAGYPPKVLEDHINAIFVMTDISLFPNSVCYTVWWHPPAEINHKMCIFTAKNCKHVLNWTTVQVNTVRCGYLSLYSFIYMILFCCTAG